MLGGYVNNDGDLALPLNMSNGGGANAANSGGAISL